MSDITMKLVAGAFPNDILLAWARIPIDRLDDVIGDVKAVLEKYATDGVGERKRTKRTVCKTNVREALRSSRLFDGEYCDVNDDWKASFWGYNAELYDWKNDVTITVAVPWMKSLEKELEIATEQLMEEYAIRIG